MNGTMHADPALLIQQLRLLIATPDAFTKNDEERRAILKLAQGVCLLEQPFETMERIIYTPLPLNTARTAQSLGVYDKLQKAGKISAANLATSINLDVTKTEALLDYLCTQHQAIEVSPQTYAPTRLTSVLASSLLKDAITVYNDMVAPSLQGMSLAFLSNTLAFHIGHKTPLNVYSWIQSIPSVKAAFPRFMQAGFAALPPFTNVYDFTTEVPSTTSPEDVLMVDVGGSEGHQGALIRTTYSALPGRIINQDRPEILSTVPDIPGVEKMPYDYFTPQPIMNAHVYYFRQILHNNTDENCIKILKNHVYALGPDSVILIDDKCLPDEKDPEGSIAMDYLAALNLNMRCLFGAHERREAHWRALIPKAGLVIKDIRIFTEFRDAIIVIGKT